MGFQLVIDTDTSIRLGIEGANRSLSISHIHALGRGVIAQIVRIVPELNAGHRSVAGAVKHFDGPISGIRNVKAIEFCDVERALRIRQTGDTVDSPAGKCINDLDRIVAERGDDYTLALGIDREVIQPSLYCRQRDLLYEPQRRRLPAAGRTL